MIRNIVFSFFLYQFAYFITPWAASNFVGYITLSWQKAIVSSSLWLFCWWFQGVVGAGIFCLGKSGNKKSGRIDVVVRSFPISNFVPFLGHDAGHISLSNNLVNNAVGFVLHSVTTYFGFGFSNNNTLIFFLVSPCSLFCMAIDPSMPITY